MVVVDDAALERILSYNIDPCARLCCRSWDKYVSTSLELQYRIRFHKGVREQGPLSYHHCGVRTMGEDFQECVAYQFEFFASGVFTTDWNRSFGQWSAANERQVGTWKVDGDQVKCETTVGPAQVDGCVQFAPAGRKFSLPVDAVLARTSQSDDKAPKWEYAVRGVPVPDVQMESVAPVSDVSGDGNGALWQAMANDNARFVDIDGELHEVSADIAQTYPEAEWVKLMRCRVRFGLS